METSSYFILINISFYGQIYIYVYKIFIMNWKIIDYAHLYTYKKLFWYRVPQRNYRTGRFILDSLWISFIGSEERRCNSSYPSVPLPDMGGLGGFWVGGFVLDSVPVLAGWLFPCWNVERNAFIFISNCSLGVLTPCIIIFKISECEIRIPRQL